MTHTKRMLVIVLLLAAMTLIGACGGAGSTTLADVVEQVAQQGGAAGAIDAAQATVSARSLRVRAAPSATAEVVGGIREGEVYTVIGLSSDGEWVQLAVPAIPGGTGWVSTNYVSVQGAITSATITEAVPVTAPVAAPVAPVSALQLPTPTPPTCRQPKILCPSQA
jgi:uncharacterized protein YraI